MVILYLWIVYVAVVKAQQTYVNTFSDDKTWQCSNNNCKLAVPTLTYTHDGILAKLDNTDLQPGDKAWIGYVHSFKIFQYTGCVNLDKITTHSKIVMRSDLGNCFSACNNKYFGIQQMKNTNSIVDCYCLGGTVHAKSFNDLASTKCTSECIFPKGTSCGGDGYLSVYEAVPDTGLENVVKSTQLCGAYNIGDAQWKWKMCSLPSMFICDKEYIKANAEATVYKYESADIWREASYICFGKNKYPAKYNAQFDQTQNSSSMYKGDVWTGLLRSYVVEKKTQTSRTTLFGYIEVTGDNNYHVRFTTEDDSLGKALCTNGSIQPTISTFSPYTEKTSKVGIYIGIVVAVVVLVCFGVLGFVCWHRWYSTAISHGVLSQHQPSEKETPKCNDTKKSVNTDENCMYAIPDANVYYDCGVAMDNDVRRATNQDDGAYDTTASTFKVVTVAVTTENAYSTLRTTDDTYSHTITYPNNKTKVLTSRQRADENEYDSCNNIQDKTVAGKATDASTSEYSHIALTRNTSKQTDNVYAKLNVGINNKCDLGDADYERTDNSTNAMEELSSNDAYSHGNINSIGGVHV